MVKWMGSTAHIIIIFFWCSNIYLTHFWVKFWNCKNNWAYAYATKPIKEGNYISILEIFFINTIQKWVLKTNLYSCQPGQIKSTFIMAMSHELYVTPLNSIIGFSDLLKQKILEDERNQEIIVEKHLLKWKNLLMIIIWYPWSFKNRSK